VLSFNATLQVMRYVARGGGEERRCLRERALILATTAGSDVEDHKLEDHG
jgi:hypothetical protein